MGVSLRIGLYSGPGSLPKAVVSLYERLMARGWFNRATVNVGGFDQDKTPDYVYMTEEQLEAIVEDISAPLSDKGLSILLNYELRSGEVQALGLEVYGPRFGFGRGLKASTEGQLVLGIELTDLFRTPSELLRVRRGLDLGTNKGPMEKDTEANDAGSRQPEDLQSLQDQEKQDNARELFFRACGLSEAASDCSNIRHAAMHAGTLWPSPVRCSMIYHRDPYGFFRDFVRIYLEYNRGIPTPTALQASNDLWHLSPPGPFPQWGIGVPGKEMSPSRYMDHATPGTRDILDFLDSLSEQRARQLSSLPSQEARELLSEIAQRNPIGEMEVHGFAGCGYAIVGVPDSSVWRLYKYIADRVS